MRQKIIGATSISFAAVLWGLDGVVLTPRLYNLNVGFVIFVFHLLPFVLMNFFLPAERKYLRQFSRSDFISFGLVAFFGGALGTLAIVKAIFLVNFQHLSIVVLLQKLQPIFAITLAALLLKEKITKNFIGWAVLAVVGSYFLTFGWHLPSLATGKNTILAALWAVVAAFSFGSATVFGKKVLQKYSFRTSTYYRFGFTALIMLIFVLFTGQWADFKNVTPVNWTVFLIIALTTGSGAIFVYYYGLKKVKAMVSTICELFFPISAITFDYLVNGVRLSLLQWLGAAVIVFSIIQITKKRSE